MKRSVAIVFVLVLLLTCTLSIDTSGEEASIRLTGVLPTSSFEGVEITNYGTDIDLRECSISDGEGTISFTTSIILDKGKSVWILKTEPSNWFPSKNYLVIGSEGISSSKFILNDTGDDIYLNYRGTVIDSFVYGDIEGDHEGWNGTPFDKISKHSFATRISFFDTDSASDWKSTVPGRTENESTVEYEVEVEPFVFPESKGLPILNALSKAQREVDISIYSLSQNDVVYALERLLKNDVSVNILCDGSPVGGINENELTALATLSDDGADVRLIKQDDDGFKRYSYLHNKYAIIDESNVILTSENWVDSSFAGNRGWGVIVNSSDYAQFMKSVFFNDFDDSNTDIFDFRALYPEEKSAIYYSELNVEYERQAFDAKIRPVLSPDNSYSSVRELISSAKEKVYSEQLDVQYSWLQQTDNPLQWMISQGEKGLDCRLLLDVTFDSEEDEDYEDNYGVISYLSGNPGIACKRVVGNFSNVHNKGIIVDDKVWIGSVNWTNNSFLNNRESAVIIESKDISDYFTGYYLTDWGISEDAIVPKIVVKGEMKDGESFVLDASTSIVNPGSTFLWDTDNDGNYELNGSCIMVTLPSGEHTVSLMITDTEGNVKVLDYPISVSEKTTMIDFKYIPLIFLCAMILLIKGVKKFRARCG